MNIIKENKVWGFFEVVFIPYYLCVTSYSVVNEHFLYGIQRNKKIDMYVPL